MAVVEDDRAARHERQLVGQERRDERADVRLVSARGVRLDAVDADVEWLYSGVAPIVFG